jgi:tRNA A-37 threonylcarbamoyl transferase component Bud32
MTLQQHIEQLLAQPQKNRAFSTTYNGEKIWIKLPAMGESNMWHSVLKILFKITHNPLLAPTVVTNPKQSLKDEGLKLKHLDSLGINVPKVLLATDEYLALSDCGTPLSVLIKKDNITEENKSDIFAKLATTLSSMHNNQMYHSRPALRDITYHNGNIYFMDFEENLEGILTTEEAILRDAMIFIHALYRKVPDEKLINQTLLIYTNSLHPNILQNLKNEAQKYKILYFLLKISYKILGKDAKAIFKTLNFLIF